MIQAGRLNHQVQIVRLTPTQNDAGETIDTPDDYQFVSWVWASVREQGAAEQTRNGITVGEATYAVRLRHRDDIDQTCRLVYRDRQLEIVSIVEAGHGNREFLDIVAKGTA